MGAAETVKKKNPNKYSSDSAKKKAARPACILLWISAPQMHGPSLIASEAPISSLGPKPPSLWKHTAGIECMELTN